MNRVVLSCLTWLTVRFARRPLSLFWPSHFQRNFWSLELPAFQLVIGSSRSVVQHVLVRSAARYPKSRVMKPLLAPLIGRGLFASEDADVTVIRRMFVRAIAQVSEETIEATTRQLFAEYQVRWRRDGDLARLPVSSEMSRLTVDIASECLFRTQFTEAESAEFTALFFHYQFLASPLRLYPWVGKRVFAPIRRWRQARIAARMRALMRRRFADGLRDPQSPLSTSPFAKALAERERAGEPPLTGERLLDEVAVMLLAGHETSASALSWLLRALAADESLQQRLRDEARRAVRSSDGETPLTRSVINEILRLYPPIPIYARDATVADTIEDRPVKAGALVLVSPWVIHRHAQLWDDPRTFNPDRFVATAPSEATGKFLPFGFGPRACPGSRFAMVEMQTLVIHLMLAYRLRPLAGKTAHPLGNLTTRPDREIFIALEPLAPSDDRESSAAGGGPSVPASPEAAPAQRHAGRVTAEGG
jgi:cytochrome P450